jgi:hypothetical protein
MKLAFILVLVLSSVSATSVFAGRNRQGANVFAAAANNAAGKANNAAGGANNTAGGANNTAAGANNTAAAAGGNAGGGDPQTSTSKQLIHTLYIVLIAVLQRSILPSFRRISRTMGRILR